VAVVEEQKWLEQVVVETQDQVELVVDFQMHWVLQDKIVALIIIFLVAEAEVDLLLVLQLELVVALA
jgi:hypothetical protein